MHVEEFNIYFLRVLKDNEFLLHPYNFTWLDQRKEA